MSTRTSFLLVAIGSVLFVGSCIAIVVLGGLPPIARTPYTFAGWVLGVAAVVGGFVWLVYLAVRPSSPNRTDSYPARQARDGIPARRLPASRVHAPVRKARTRGGQVAPPGNGGGAATSDATTEELPAVEDDGWHWPSRVPTPGRGWLDVTVVLPTLAALLRGGEYRTGWAGASREPSRSTKMSAHGPRGGRGRIVAGSFEGCEPATLLLPAATDTRRTGAPQRSPQTARGAAALALPPRTGARAVHKTWTGGGVVSTAALDETAHLPRE